jgi:hypothetical protein
LKKTAAIQYNVEKAFRPGMEQMSRLEEQREQRGPGSERTKRDRLSL